MSEEQLAAIETRLAATMEGPWLMYSDSGEADWCVGTEQQRVDEEALAVGLLREDAAFIAHSRADVPLLLGEVWRLRGEVGLLQRRLKRAIYLAGVHGCKLGPVELDSHGQVSLGQEQRT